MENRPHVLQVALFIIGLTITTGAAVFWFSAGRPGQVPYELLTNGDVMGLRAHAAVRYRGVDVGDVRSIHLDPAHPGRIAIHILVNRDTPVTHSTFGCIEFQGVTGIRFVQLDDTGSDPALLPSSANRTAQIPMQPGPLDQLQEDVAVLGRRFAGVGDRVESMRSSDMRNQLATTAASLRHAARSLSMLMQQAHPIISQLPATVSRSDHALLSASVLISSLNAPDGQRRSNLGKLDAGARQIDEAAPSIHTSLEDLSARVGDDLLPGVNPLAVDVANAMRSMKRAAGRLPITSPSFGMPGAAPGPGEPGFRWPVAGHGVP